MKKTVLRYGLYATLVIVGLGMFNLFVLAKMTGYAAQEVAGYLTMCLSMIFVFAGIKYYRDHENGGMLSFGEGLKVGLLIVLIPAVLFGLFDMLYTQVLNPGWSQQYYSHYLEQVKINTPPDKLEAALKKTREEMEMFSNPVILFLVMSFTVFIIGVIATIISTLWLRRNKALAIS